MDFSKTLQLPKTEFPMKANLPVREPEIQAKWDSANLYSKLQELRTQQQAREFVLHDGPPYANGHIHLGTALNKVLKDMVVRSRSMDGYRAPYVPGWDTHGLPIEQRVIKDLGLNRRAVSPLEYRRMCREYALKYMDIMRTEFKRLGVWGEWENPYLTLDPSYEAAQIRVFGEMAKRGYIYKGKKPVYWCSTCETALAEAEIEYADKESPSIYVAFDVVDDKGLFSDAGSPVRVIIWTTTPWTIPANMAIAVHPDFEYSLVDAGDDRSLYIVAAGLLEQVKDALGWPQARRLKSWYGRELEGIVCRHPLVDRDSPIILGEHVTLEQGTGCVHTAPGHGLEDYEIGTKYGLPVFAPVDDEGRFTSEAGKYHGKRLEAANSEIVEDLRSAGALLGSEELVHQYPHCWRCKDPVIFRATEQWFASIDGFRDQALSAIKDVQWVPEWGVDRITNMVKDRHDWCISRQRIWGVPIPIFYCESCGEHLINDETIKAVSELFEREGSDSWWAREASEILPEGTKCQNCGGTGFRKETDIMDVWFDSGSSHAAVLTPERGLSWPADLYLEGSDQHRGWFQSSLLTAVATTGRAPYRTVLTHGFTVDEEGRKMSKSLGNVIAPGEIIDKYGADVLRLWAASSDYRGDIRISEGILSQISEAYRRIRNTFRFMLGNLSDFVVAEHSLNPQELLPIDKWILVKLERLTQRVKKAYRDYEFHIVYHSVHNFCTVELSSFYLDVLKDRLYCDPQDSKSRRSAQTAMHLILTTLAKLVAPILVHTADEVWSYLEDSAWELESVHLTTWPESVVSVSEEDEELEERWDTMLRIRKDIARALEIARKDRLIGSSNEAQVDIYTGEESYNALVPFLGELEHLLIVSRVIVHLPAEKAPENAVASMDGSDVKVLVSRAPGRKCERCWKYSETVGKDSDLPELCHRCATVIHRNGTGRKPAEG